MFGSLALRKELSKLRRRIFETAGSARYSRPALNDLDRKLERYLGFRNGFFVEAGANDGFSQSNTYYLERFQGWSGILIEGIPELHQRCVIERPRAQAFQVALVANDYDKDMITMRYANLMSLVEGARKSKTEDLHHVLRGASIQEGTVPYEIAVPARPLTWVLDQVRPAHIDFLSLDVEGYELDVLKGLDFRRYRPSFLLVEANFRCEVTDFLRERQYTFVEQISSHDVLFRAD